MSEQPQEREVAEGRGVTLGEAKWAAVKELQRHYPGASSEQVSFEVIEEPQGDEGEAVVEAVLDFELWQEQERQHELPGEADERVREVLERILNGFGLRATVSIEEDDEEIFAEVNGADLGILIGKYGRTIDAVQLIASQIAFQSSADRKRVVVDAAGYRERRRQVVERSADKAADEAVNYGREVELDPMGAADRKTAHLYLQERGDVETHSEGFGSQRRVVVTPTENRLAD